MECLEEDNLQVGNMNPVSRFPPELIDEIFGYLGVKDLKNCRKVCADWNDAVLESKPWKERAMVLFRTKSLRIKKMKELAKLLETGKWHSFSKNFQIMLFGMAVPRIFWTKCGENVTILRLFDVGFESVEDFQTRIYKGCPNMVELSLHRVFVRLSDKCPNGRTFGVKEPTEVALPLVGEHQKLKFLEIEGKKTGYGVSWMELLSHFPRLETLKLDGYIPTSAGLFASLTKLRQVYPNKWKLKHFIMNSFGYDRDDSTIVRLLTDPVLHLETIRLIVTLEAVQLQEMLRVHAASIKKLSLKGDVIRREDSFRIFPLPTSNGMLEALQELNVYKYPFQSLEFLKFTPNLRKLRIYESNAYNANIGIIANTELSVMEDFSLKTCTWLKFEFGVGYEGLEIEDLGKLIKWLPNVTKLKMRRVRNPHFQMICEGWPGLVKLSLINTFVDDAGLTGLDMDQRYKATMKGSRRYAERLNMSSRKANITDLKNLRYLELDFGGFEDAVLGRRAAVFGIMRLPKLAQLHIRHCRFKGAIWKRLQARKTPVWLP